MKKRIAATVIAGAVFVMAIAFATAAQAFPNKTSQCSGCHGVDPAVVVTATQISNNGATASYNVTVNDAYGDGVTGWAVFDGTTNIANAYGAGSFTAAVGKTYTVWGVAGAGGAGSNSVRVSPVAPPPPPSDTTPPSVSLTSPANGATVSGTVGITASASDNVAVSKVEFYVDGLLLSTDTSAPYAASWNSTGAAPGSHAIQAKAFDAAGNTGSSSVAVSIAPPPDTTPPSVAITAPQNASTVAGAVAIAANASDAGGIARVEFRVDNVLLGSDTVAPYTSIWNSVGASVGAHTITATAYDNAGNSAVSTVSITIAPPADTTAPSVSVTSPGNGATVSGVVAIAASASDNVGVTKVEFYVDGALVGTDATSPYSANWDTSAVAPGSHAIQAKAFDAVGNSASSSIAVSIAPPADTTPPTVGITSPGNGATVSGSVTVNATASDNVGVASVAFYVDGALMSTDSSAPYSFVWESAGVAPGTHAIEVRAYDAAGNAGASSISVSIAAPPPPTSTSAVTVTVSSGTAGASASTGVFGAKVILKNSATGVRYSGITTAAGTVQFASLPYGTYTVTVSARGHKRALSSLVVDAPAENLAVTLSAR